MPLDQDFGRDAAELARMSLEADSFDDKMLLLRMALLVKRQACVEEHRQDSSSENSSSQDSSSQDSAF